MNKIALVFAGGGGKGAYQIGVWKAIRELHIEEDIRVISGTSVGALNAALFLKGNLEFAEQLWLSISPSLLLPLQNDATDSIFSNSGLHSFVRQVVSVRDRKTPPCCYVACKRLRDGAVKYYDLTSKVSSQYREKLLLASAALPGIYPSVWLNGEEFVDGGANGDNVPVYPVYKELPDQIIVVHLSKTEPVEAGQWRNTEVYDIYPSEDLGGLLTGTIDFSPEHVTGRMKLGYNDALCALNGLAQRLRAASTDTRHSIRLPSYDSIIPLKNITLKGSTGEMKTIKFKEDNLREQYEKRLEELKAIANAPESTTAVMWDATAQKYAGVVHKVSNMLKQEELQSEVSERITKQISSFLEKCSKPEFHIALVGAIKAGKSSLINAILDEELASTEVTPETAALTKFRGNPDGDKISILFYSDNEWKKLWHSVQDVGDSKFMEEFRNLNAEQEKSRWVNHEPIVIEPGNRDELKKEIQKWTSSRSATHYFVKEVEVSLKDLSLPAGVILVDTPGLNDAIEYRSNITKDYIDRANAVFVCVKADRLSGQELATIYGVFSNARYNPEKIYIIATQQDSLNNPVEDWKKQRRVWLGLLQEKACYGNLKLAERNLISTSGYLYTLLRNTEHLNQVRRFQLFSVAMKFQVMPDKITEHYEELLDFSAIEQLKRRMNHDILEKYRELLREDIRNGYTQVKDCILELMKQVRARQEEIISMASKDIEEIRKKEEENREKLAEAEREQKDLDELYRTIKKSTAEQKKQVADAIRALGGAK